MHDSDCQVCNADTPYPSVSHESVPSLIDNLASALYGQINKNVAGGRVIWDIPCDPVTAPATVFGIARNTGEGLLCYFIRAFNAANNGGTTYYGSFVGELTGNASTATTLKTARSFSITGAAEAAAQSFNGSANLVLNTTISNLPDSSLSTISTAGKVLNSATTASSSNTANSIVARDASGNFSTGAITGSLLGNATSATNLAGGAINQIPYQTAANATSFLNAGSNGQVLGILAGALQWVSAPAAATASAIAGGAAGQVHWQSALNTTAFTAAGTTGQVLSSNGTSAPTWITPTSANTPSTIVARDASGLINVGSLFVNNPSGDTRVELGGTNSVYIDLKNPNSDDYDLRVGTTAGASSISTAASQPLAIDATSAVLSLNVSGGNVGIGTASPVVTLDVNKAGGQLRVSDGSVDMRMQPLVASSVGNIGTISAHDVVLVANNSEKLRIAQSGNVGIGTTTPATKLQVSGDITATRLIANGAGDVGTNVAIGQAALALNTTGSRNTAVGQGTLSAVTTADRNTAIGNQALQLTTGGSNTAVGAVALNSNTSGTGNIAIGASTGTALTTGNTNTIIGSYIAGTAGMANTLILGAGGVERIRVEADGTIDAKGGAIINSKTTAKAWVNFDGSTAGVFAGGASSVTRLVGSTTATITTTTPHGLITGSVVWVLTGVVAGKYSVVVTTANSFTITTAATTALTNVAITFQVSAIRDKYNVSSITKNGPRDYIINFLTALNNFNYAMAVSGFSNGTSYSDVITGYPINETTAQVKVNGTYSSPNTDPTIICAIIFGN